MSRIPFAFVNLMRSQLFVRSSSVNVRSLHAISSHSRPNRPLFPISLVTFDKSKCFSYASCPVTTPLLTITVGNAIDQSVEKFESEREAVVSCYQNRRLTFFEMKKEVDKFACGLLSLGLQQGDRVGIMGPNSVEWYITQLATMKAGLILVNVNPAYQSHELEYCVNLVNMKALIIAESFKSTNYVEMLHTIAPESDLSDHAKLKCKQLPTLQHIVMLTDGKPSPLEHGRTFSEILEAGDNPDLMNALAKISTLIQFDDPCNIQFTSGTTGKPKGAVLSHFNIINNAYFVGHRMHYHRKSHRICTPVPLYHCFGCVVSVTASILHGSTVVLPAAGFDAPATLKAVQDERCTSLYGTPTMFVDLLHSPSFLNADCSSLETGIMAGAPCPAPLVREVREKLNMKDFCIVFGMTETSPVTFATFPYDPDELRANTVGTLLPHLEALVVNSEGRALPRGQRGELWVRGYCNFLGYWGDPKKTEEILTPARWLKTGDITVMDKNGYLTVVGRSKDMVIRGGENIYPKEIEFFLMTHPFVAAVYVFGVPDDRLGEDLCAWVKLKPGHESSLTAQDLRAWCKGQIAHFKIPHHIQFRSDYPLTVSGKVQKFRMREIFVAEMNDAR